MDSHGAPEHGHHLSQSQSLSIGSSQGMTPTNGYVHINQQSAMQCGLLTSPQQCSVRIRGHILFLIVLSMLHHEIIISLRWIFRTSLANTTITRWFGQIFHQIRSNQSNDKKTLLLNSLNLFLQQHDNWVLNSALDCWSLFVVGFMV